MSIATAIAPGVLRHEAAGHAVYTGRAESLIGAQLVAPHDLPGQAGKGRGIVVIEGDATTPPKRIVACMRDGEPQYEVWQPVSHWPFPLIGDTIMGTPVRGAPQAAEESPATVAGDFGPSIDLTDEQRFFVAQVPSVLRAIRERTAGALPKVVVDLQAMQVEVLRQ